MVAGLMLATTLPASAVFLGLDPTPWNTATATPLSLDPVQPGGNQPTNLPCIICGANQPQQPDGLGYNLFGNQGNETVLSYFSTATVGGSLALDQFIGATGYSILPGSPLLNALGGNLGFSIGIDVNQTGAVAQNLESFFFLNLTTHTVLASYVSGLGAGTPIGATANGTGFPDWTISGLTLAGVNSGDQIMFFARMSGLNDGPDSFFLIPNQLAEVPLPGAVWLFGTVLAGLFGGKKLRDFRRKFATA